MDDSLTKMGDIRATLGEGPVWHNDELLWVDIYGRTIHRYEPVTGRHHSIGLDQHVGAVVPHVSGVLLAAVEEGFAVVDDESGELRLLAAVETELARNRMNDGKCDSAGRFWAGTQSEDLTPGAGSLYRLDLDGVARSVLGDVTVSNGLGWSPDDRTMYFIDTATSGLDAFDYDSAHGTVSNRRRLVSFDESDGLPDGMAVDAVGHLWVAFWGGGAVRRYTPAGALDLEVMMPVTHPTSCAFGGPALDRLYITSSRMTEGGPFDEATLMAQPLAGAVFVMEAPARGLPTNICRVTLDLS